MTHRPLDPPPNPHPPGRAPLADRMRPRDLSEYEGQEHLLGPGKPLRELVSAGMVPSMVLWGPPGTGKTTLAHLVSDALGSRVVAYSAVLTGIKEVRDVMAEAAVFFDRQGARTVVFIDEIHRFNRAQQDAFLPFLEKGPILLIGTTTVNPSFDLNAALLSRLRVFTLRPLATEAIERLLARALADPERGLGRLKLDLPEPDRHRLAVAAGGDARRALNALEQLADYLVRAGRTAPAGDDLDEVLHGRTALYDRDGEEHYNMLSALHKSMRNSDPDAAVYWAGRMIEAGEPPRNICRRVLQCASEDVGLADNTALHVAVTAWQAFELLGLPEGRLAVLQAVLYVAMAPKSNAVLRADQAVRADLQRAEAQPVPLHLRNAPTRLMRQEGYGQGYLYAHDHPEGTTDMPCLPPALSGRRYYIPGTAGLEGRIAEKLEEIQRRKARFTDRRRQTGS